MLTFATEFSVSSDHSIADFLAVCEKWIIGSPHTSFSNSDLSKRGNSSDWQIQKNNEDIRFINCKAADWDLGGLRYLKHENGLDWTTEVVGSRKNGAFWIAVRVSCDSSTALPNLPRSKKPQIVRLLLDELGGGNDGDLQLQDTPLFLGNNHIDFAGLLLLGKANNRLPIIFLSASPQNTCLVNAKRLARQLSGMAHVVVEPNTAFSSRLRIEVENQNVFGGAIGVYWPDGAGREVYKPNSENRTPKDTENAVEDDVRAALAHRRPLPSCSWPFLQESLSRISFEMLRQAGSTEISQYIDAFDTERKAGVERLEEAEREIRRLEAAVHGLNAKVAGQTSGSLLSLGSELDFYKDEIKQIAIDAIEQSASSATPDSRRQHVLLDLFAANNVSSDREAIADQVKSLLKSYKSMDSRTRSGLEKLGFSLSEDGKHYKAVFQGDGRYTFILSKTSSDHRSGLNLVSEIRGKLL